MGNQIQRGSSLVEVMVALFVLAIGILGVLAMQSKSMQYNQSAYTYSQAVYLANDIAERIRGNIDTAASSYANGIPATEGTDCRVATLAALNCTQAQLIAWDLYNWNDKIKRTLPSGQGAVATTTMNERNFLKISVSFDDSRSDGSQLSIGTADHTGRQDYSLVIEYTDIGQDLFVPTETPEEGGSEGGGEPPSEGDV